MRLRSRMLRPMDRAFLALERRKDAIARLYASELDDAVIAIE